MTVICSYLKIDCEVVISSTLQIDHSLQGQEKVLALSKYVGGDVYINAIGGQELYSKETFTLHGIELQFLKSTPFEYEQFNHDFVPWLSIIDVMMFNPLENIRERLSNYTLI